MLTNMALWRNINCQHVFHLFSKHLPHVPDADLIYTINFSEWLVNVKVIPVIKTHINTEKNIKKAKKSYTKSYDWDEHLYRSISMHAYI